MAAASREGPGASRRLAGGKPGCGIPVMTRLPPHPALSLLSGEEGGVRQGPSNFFGCLGTRSGLGAKRQTAISPCGESSGEKRVMVRPTTRTDGGGMKIISGRIAVTLCLLLVCVLPADSQDPNDQLLQELFAKSGINHLTEQLPVIFQEGMDQASAQDPNLAKLPNDVLREIKDAAAAAYASQKMRNVMLKSMSGKLSDIEVRSVIQWLDSPVGIKSTELEKKSLAPEWIKEMARFEEEIQRKPPPAARLKLIGELDRATQATSASVEMFINTNMAIATAVILSLPAEARRPLPEIRKELEANRAAIEKTIQEQTQVSMLCTYHPLSDGEIQQYIDFANSPLGSKFNTVSIAAFQQALVEGGIDFGRAVAAVFENMGKKTKI
jgi:hypothetical protein